MVKLNELNLAPSGYYLFEEEKERYIIIIKLLELVHCS